MATTTGTSGNDSWIVVKAGTFTLDGLGGIDTLALGTSLRSEYTIRQVGTAVLDSISAALPAARLTNKAVVDLLFTNVVGVVPTVDQAKPYLDLLDNHTFTVAQLGVLAADSSFNTNQIGLTGQLVQTGLHYV